MKAILWLAAAAFFQTAPMLEQSSRQGLEEAVQTYWDLLLRRDRNQAMEFVSPPSRPWFLARHEPPFRAWKLSGIQPHGDGLFQVTVVVDRLIQDGFFKWKVREDWIRTESGWKVQIQNQALARKKVWEAHTPVQAEPGILDLRPAALRLHFFSGSQRGDLWIRNGLQESVEVTSLEFDDKRFELIDSIQSIPAQSVAKISIRYKGGETEKGLGSSLSLSLKPSEGDEAVFSVPITYNLISRAARGLLKLTPEQAQRLKKTDKVQPRGANPPGGH